MFSEFQAGCFGIAEAIVGCFLYWYWMEKQNEKKHREKQERKEKARRRVLDRYTYDC